MLKFKCINTLLFLVCFSNAAFSAEKMDDDIESVNRFTRDYLNDLHKITLLELKPTELYFDKIKEVYLSSKLDKIEPERRARFTDESYRTLNSVHGFVGWFYNGEILQSKIEGKYACVFLAKEEGVIGLFLINEAGWKFLDVAIYSKKARVSKPKSCLLFSDEIEELDVQDVRFLFLDESKEQQWEDRR